MALIPEIDKLLAIDEENIRETRRFLTEVSNDLPEAMNEAVVLFKTANRAFGQGLTNHFGELVDQIAAFSVSSIQELALKLAGPVPPSQQAVHNHATAVLNRFYARESRGVLLARMGVLYATAAADLLRLRVTAPLGFVRIQCESLALMDMMRSEPLVAREWRDVLSPAEGKGFYLKYQHRVRVALRKFELEFAYDNASSTALHSRFAGIAMGLEVRTEVEQGRISQHVQVKAQEINPDNPDLFLLVLLHVLRVQERLLRGLPVTCPEIDDRLLSETRIPRFTAAVDALLQQFARRRPDLASRIVQSSPTGTGASAGNGRIGGTTERDPSTT